MSNQIRFIRNVLYNLKKEFGFDCTFQVISEVQKDYISGVRATTTTPYIVKKVIRLPDETSRLTNLDFIFKQYSMSPKIDKSVRLFIVDAKSLPTGYMPALDHHILMGSHVYQIIKIEELDSNLGYLISGQEGK